METETLILKIEDDDTVKVPESFMKKYNITRDMEFCVSCVDNVIVGKTS